MSIDVMSAVWRQSQQKGSGLLLLLSLADYANERGVAFPSVETLAAKTRMTARNVQILLRKLEADGEIVIDAAAGPGGANRYRLTVVGGENFSPQDPPKTTRRGEKFSPGGVKRLSPGGETAFTGGVKPASPDPSFEPPIDPSGEERAAAVPPAPAAPAVVVEVAETQTATATTPLTLTTHPAVRVYHDAFLAWPSRAQMLEIIRHGVDDLPRWEGAVTAWLRAGHSPRNIGGMLDWYDNPARIPSARPRGAPATAPAGSKVAASMQAVDQVLAMLNQHSEEVTP